MDRTAVRARRVRPFERGACGVQKIGGKEKPILTIFLTGAAQGGASR